MLSNRKLGVMCIGMRLLRRRVCSRVSHVALFPGLLNINYLNIYSMEKALEILHELLMEAKGSKGSKDFEFFLVSIVSVCCCSGQKKTCMVKTNHYECCSIYTFHLLPPGHFSTFTGLKIDAVLRFQLR